MEGAKLKMSLNPGWKNELETRRLDILRRALALENVHGLTIPDTDPPAGIQAHFDTIWTDIQQVEADTQALTIPDTDPPAGVIATLQSYELQLHDIENRLLNPPSS